MTDLHLIEAPLNLRALHVWAETRGLSQRGRLDEGRALHHLLDEAFGPASLRPFRLMQAPAGPSATIYAYSLDDADHLRARAADFATPVLCDILRPERLRSLPRSADRWQSSQRLGFDLRLRPVVRLGGPIPGTRFAKGREVDAFLAEALRHHGGITEGMKATGRTRQEVYLDWLADRLGGAATICRASCRLASFRRSRVHRGGRCLDGPDAVIHGTMTVADPGGFADRLARGVGRHRVYGFGMLLLRPPQRC